MHASLAFPIFLLFWLAGSPVLPFEASAWPEEFLLFESPDPYCKVEGVQIFAFSAGFSLLDSEELLEAFLGDIFNRERSENCIFFINSF